MATLAVHGDLPDRPAVVSLAVVWAGDPDAADKAIRPLRRDLPVLVDDVKEMSYLELQAMAGRLPFGLRHYWKGHFLRALDSAVIGGLVDSLTPPPGALGLILLESIHGRARREPEGGSAFGLRHATWNASALAIWEHERDDDAQIAWARATADRVGVGSLTGAGYANYAPVDETEDRVRLAFGANRFARLAAVKRRYDPDNRFRFNLNIPPGPARVD